MKKIMKIWMLWSVLFFPLESFALSETMRSSCVDGYEKLRIDLSRILDDKDASCAYFTMPIEKGAIFRRDGQDVEDIDKGMHICVMGEARDQLLLGFSFSSFIHDSVSFNDECKFSASLIGNYYTMLDIHFTEDYFFKGADLSSIHRNSRSHSKSWNRDGLLAYGVKTSGLFGTGLSSYLENTFNFINDLWRQARESETDFWNILRRDFAYRGYQTH